MRAFLVSRLLWTATLTFLVATAGTSAGLLADLQFTRTQRSAGSPAAAAQTPSTPEEIQGKQGDRPTSKLTPAQVQAILKAHGPLRDYEFKGRVVDPAGKPVAGAKVYVFGAPSSDQPKATIGPDGRFQFTLKGTDPMKGSRVAAVADGYAMTGASRAFQYFYDTIPNDTPESGRDLTIALVPDFPVTGQVVDPEGKPIAGVSIRSSFVYAARADRLDRFIQAIKTREGRKDDTEFKYLKQDRVNDWWRMVHEILATTDAQGRFVLRGISRESLAILSVDGPTIRPTDVHVLTRPGEPLQALISAPFPEFGSITYYGASPRITVSPGRVVEGVVRDAETGEALPKALITSEKLADSDVWNNAQLRATADADGRYRLTGLPLGAGNLVNVWPQQKQLYPPAQVEVPNAPGTGPIPLDIQLPRGVMIVGRLTDAQTGQPLRSSPSLKVAYHAAANNANLARYPGFNKKISSHSYLFGVRPGPDGQFQVAGLPGPGALVVNSVDRSYPDALRNGEFRRGFVPQITFAQAIVPVDIPAVATTFHRDLNLQAGRSLDATVVDAEGKPVAGALVYGLDGTWWNHAPLPSATIHVVGLLPPRNDAQGKPVPSRTLVATQPERKLTGWVDLKGDEPGPVQVKVSPWATVTARVVDEHGKPRARVVVWFNAPHPSAGTDRVYYEPGWVWTDADGRFRIEGLAPGLSYTFGINPPEGQKSSPRFTTYTPARPGEIHDLGTLAFTFNPIK